ncbi:hypothetical protein BD309DRAFT_593745 [Dichomitus squalens]|nr:hypothetical protein BD309DRAFT_593745 [Dichomitus squalens]
MQGYPNPPLSSVTGTSRCRQAVRSLGSLLIGYGLLPLTSSQMVLGCQVSSARKEVGIKEEASQRHHLCDVGASRSGRSDKDKRSVDARSEVRLIEDALLTSGEVVARSAWRTQTTRRCVESRRVSNRAP